MTQFNFWSFTLLAAVWLCKVKKNPGAVLSKLGASTNIAVVLFALVLLLEATYVTYQFLTYDIQVSFIFVVNKCAELIS